MASLLSKILSTILLQILGKLLTEAFLKKLIIMLSVKGLEHVKKMNLIKASDVDEESIELVINVLKEVK